MSTDNPRECAHCRSSGNVYRTKPLINGVTTRYYKCECGTTWAVDFTITESIVEKRSKSPQENNVTNLVT